MRLPSSSLLRKSGTHSRTTVFLFWLPEVAQAFTYKV